MPEVTHRAGNVDTAEAFIVTTYAAGDKYRYILERLDEDTVTCVEKRRYDGDTGTWDDLDPEATDSVEEEMGERGFTVE
jgi:hypothetical protein